MGCRQLLVTGFLGTHVTFAAVRSSGLVTWSQLQLCALLLSLAAWNFSSGVHSCSMAWWQLLWQLWLSCYQCWAWCGNFRRVQRQMLPPIRVCELFHCFTKTSSTLCSRCLGTRVAHSVHTHLLVCWQHLVCLQNLGESILWCCWYNVLLIVLVPSVLIYC